MVQPPSLSSPPTSSPSFKHRPTHQSVDITHSSPPLAPVSYSSATSPAASSPVPEWYLPHDTDTEDDTEDEFSPEKQVHITIRSRSRSRHPTSSRSPPLQDHVMASLPAYQPWAHRCNTLDKLREAVLRRRFSLVEADVKYDEEHPVMAHDQMDVENKKRTGQLISLSAWLQSLRQWQACSRRIDTDDDEDDEEEREAPPHRKVVKLDFKDPLAVYPSLVELRSFRQDRARRQKIWINADILQGPRGRSPKFDAEAFLSLCTLQGDPSDTLSLGWTTGGIDSTSSKCGYTRSQIEEMLGLCTRYDLLSRHVTFAVRACDVVAAPGPLHQLLLASRHFTLTIWCGPEGCSRADRMLLLKQFGPLRIFLDVWDPPSVL